MPIVFPYVPETITVHLGPPDQWAENVTVSFPDYVKNVASSEIYPTWEPAAIRANVLAIISFALNRVYTEFYRSRGYPFDITASTAYDQKFIRGRDIFENVGQIVDDIFDNYIRRQGFVEPLSAKFCNGTTTTCDGLSQWGSQRMAQQGSNSLEILRSYYGPDIELVTDAPIQNVRTSYPGTPVRLGAVGDDVLFVQAALNRIGRNYPAIPRIAPTTGVFGEPTEAAVKEFQRIFSLTPDGVVGKATWYKLVSIYVGVQRLAELVSLGQTYYGYDAQYAGPLREGDRGPRVNILQYMLALLAEFDSALLPVTIDSVFGPSTTQAVRQYQSLVGLIPDGIVGEQTWDSIYNHAARAYAALSQEETRTIAQARQSIPAMAIQTSDVQKEPVARMGQFPGQDLVLGQQDRRGGDSL